MAFVEKGNVYEYDQLLSGTGHKVMELAISNKKVERGQVVTADGSMTTDASDAFGVVLETVDASSGTGKTTVVVAGEVIAEGLKVTGGTIDATVIQNLRKIGIYVKKLGGRY
ncbi:hypothetical protein IX317_000634 [Fusobacterium sp. DD29]|uniref:hypothetical protein n=1 Tax=unclassified Fusobacterium TaxID=2648384 RepID=UPI001B8D975A|nr:MULTISPECIES: hypothetical protein [unclassified Fusobacterium]MBR8700244.1 hypothetical protein [Fusobacterium sp. DD45]MBR8710501.1 hypothetical protein [Fusobacterium sp. DD28]MBR8748973.1 hypothetical protein [Fusobacterium sp. DD29]MBR8751049.1 hypothetical protein [Fusobacterium sp. DD26]MBR8761279.1 hypothetical protein [Fusobacterium sp. DD25]